MIANIFKIIDLLLRLFGLFDLYMNHIEEKYRSEIEKRRNKREKALEDLQKADSEQEFDKAQEEVVSNKP